MKLILKSDQLLGNSCKNKFEFIHFVPKQLHQLKFSFQVITAFLIDCKLRHCIVLGDLIKGLVFKSSTYKTQK